MNHIYKLFGLAVSSALMLLVLVAMLACCPYPQATDGGVLTHEDGSTDFARGMPGKAKDKIDEAFKAKGFKRYKVDVAQIAAKHWIDLSYYAGIATGLFLLAWYFTKTREFGGAAIICILFSIVAVIMAELTSNMGKIILGCSGAAAVIIGLCLRNKSVYEKLRSIWQSRKST